FPTIAARCHTIYNGVDANHFCPSLQATPQSDGMRRLLFLARISPEKGVHVLIKAFKIVVDSRPDLELDIVGDAWILPYIYLSPDRDDRPIASLMRFYGNQLSEMVRRQLILQGEGYLDDLVASAAGDNRVVFNDGVLQTDTVNFYRRATMLLVPSVWHEPFG